MEQEEKYRQAKKRIAEIKGFYAHLLAYVAVNILLFVIDLLTAGDLWFYWALLGWGIAIVIHAMVVFGLGNFFGPEWEKKKIQEEMDKLD